MLNRRSVSEIRCIEVNGVKLTWVEEIKTEIFEHFRARFRFVNTSRPLFHLADFNQIGEDDNNRLIAEFSEEEIKKRYVIVRIRIAQGTKDVRFDFIKEFWETIKGDFLRLLGEFHANRKIVRGTNNAFIELVSKHDSLTGMNGFWPISLIGCMMKVLTKILAKRMK